MLIKIKICCICLLLINACTTTTKISKEIISPVLQVQQLSPEQEEIDDIYSLLNYALVVKDWQAESIPRDKRRGYNIGALLVNGENLPVYYALNSINSTNNSTQHGEVRAITQYLDSTKQFSLGGYTVYTTLEPCIMCAGMITMTSCKRVVFGQNDVEYSKAFERLDIDTRPIGGFGPYPRKVITGESNLIFAKKLDSAFKVFLKEDKEKILSKFLASDVAKNIFSDAVHNFISYKIKYDQNKKIYDAAIMFYKKSE